MPMKVANGMASIRHRRILILVFIVSPFFFDNDGNILDDFIDIVYELDNE